MQISRLTTLAVGWLLVPALIGCSTAARTLAPIQLDQLAVISFPDSSGSGTLPGSPRVSAATSAGQRVLVPQVGGLSSLPLRWSESEGVIGPLGHWGSDSGGFVKPLFAKVGPGDSLWVFDASRRVLVFDGAGHPGREFALPLDPWDALILTDGRLVVTPANTGDAALLALLNENGELVRVLEGGAPGLRFLLSGPQGEVWSLLAMTQWRLEQWDTLLGRRAVVDRLPDWYPTYQSYRGPSRNTPPLSTVMGGWFDSTGRVWVVGRAADPQWRDGIAPATATEGDPSVVITDLDRVYDTVIEVVNPENGYQIAVGRFDTLYPLMAEPGVIGRGLAPVGGVRKVELMRVLLGADSQGN